MAFSSPERSFYKASASLSQATTCYTGAGLYWAAFSTENASENGYTWKYFQGTGSFWLFEITQQFLQVLLCHI